MGISIFQVQMSLFTKDVLVRLLPVQVNAATSKLSKPLIKTTAFSLDTSVHKKKHTDDENNN